MSGNHNSGRKPRYVTIERFEDFINNDVAHMKQDIFRNRFYSKGSFWVSLAIMTAIIAQFIIGN